MDDSKLPFDFSAQTSSLGRKRMLADLLTKSALGQPQGQMVSGHFVAPSALAQLAPILAGFGAGKLGQEVDAGQKDLSASYREGLSKGLQSYMDTREGKPGGTLSDQQAGDLLNNDQAPSALPEPVTANPRAAAVNALTSQFPELQALGKQDFASMGKANDETFGTAPAHLQDARGQLVAALIGNKGTVRPIPGYTPQQESFGAPFQRDGDWYQRDSRGKEYKLDNAPKVNVSTSVDTVGSKVSLEQAGKVLGGARQEMIDGMNARKSAERVMALSKDPATIQGFAAGPAAGLAAIGAKLGLSGPDAAAKTQALVAELSARTLQNGQDMKGSFSDKDIEFLKGVSTGSISLTPEVIQHAAGLAMAAAHNKTMDAYQQYEGASSVNGVGEILKLYPRPGINYKLDDKMFAPVEGGQVQFNSPLFAPSGQAPAQSGGAVMDFDIYRKLKGL